MLEWQKEPSLLQPQSSACLSLCAFALVSGISDYWIQEPKVEPTETVRRAIENQIDKSYTLSVDIESIVIDEEETARMVVNYSGSELADRNGWTDKYLENHFVAVVAIYSVEYDHTKTPRNDGRLQQTILPRTGGVRHDVDNLGQHVARYA